MFDFCLCVRTRLREQAGVFHYKNFNNSNFIVQFGDFMICRRFHRVESVSSSSILSKKRVGAHGVLSVTGVTS